MHANTVENFWTRVSRGDDCWLWTGSQFPSGYGRLRWQRRPMRAHRVAWLLTYGGIPPETPNVLHRCDRPLCVRPEHLFLGTHTDNVADRHRKGRSAKGERFTHPAHPRKLTEDDIAEIRAAYPRESQYALARRFGISRPQIGHIVRREQWVHVP